MNKKKHGKIYRDIRIIRDNKSISFAFIHIHPGIPVNFSYLVCG